MSEIEWGAAGAIGLWAVGIALLFGLGFGFSKWTLRQIERRDATAAVSAADYRLRRGATRLQEVMADRVAAQVYGAAAFEGGLTHVIRRSVAFDQRANREIKDAIEAARPIQNLYELPASAPENEEEAVQKAINRATTEDDTHPGPRDRFRYVAGLAGRTAVRSDAMVWSLFGAPETIMREMVAEIEARVTPHRKGIPVRQVEALGVEPPVPQSENAGC